ncbi:MAG: hypothetical protein L6R28_09685 [Planctomycetes bacterium]|nr:hypothetical protein [Planctomycetota bacterium]
MDFLTSVFLVATPTSVTMSLTDNVGAAAGIAVAAVIFTAPGLIWVASIADAFEIKSAWKRTLIQIGSFLGFVSAAWVIPGGLLVLTRLAHAQVFNLLLSCASFGVSLLIWYAMFRLDAKRIFLLRIRYKPPSD